MSLGVERKKEFGYWLLARKPKEVFGNNNATIK